MIHLNSQEARNQATKIGQASDKLTISKSVSFSSSTTVPGNASAQSTFEQLKSSSTTIQQLLTRDVGQIQSSIAAFKRADQKIGQGFERVLRS